MRHIQFASFAAVAALIGVSACGSDSSGGGGSGAGGTGTGGSTGGSAGAGTGGATGGSAGVGTGGSSTGGVAGSGTGGTSTGGAAGSGTGGTGGAATGACTNTADQAILNDPNSNVEGKVGQCAQDNLGGPGTTPCIKQQTGLSDGCVACFGNTVQCAAQNCWLQCIGDSNSAECIACRAQFCDGPFEQCSGLTVD